MNNNKHTARYQLSRFLQSDKSFELNLDAKDVSILMTIFDFMDSGDSESCFALLQKISKISRVPRRTAIDRIKKLESLKIIKSKRTNYKKIITIGELIKLDVQPLHFRGAATAHLSIYNNNYNSGALHKQKPQASVENQSTSYKPIEVKKSDLQIMKIAMKEIKKKLPRSVT